MVKRLETTIQNHTVCNRGPLCRPRALQEGACLSHAVPLLYDRYRSLDLRCSFAVVVHSLVTLGSSVKQANVKHM